MPVLVRRRVSDGLVPPGHPRRIGGVSPRVIQVRPGPPVAVPVIQISPRQTLPPKVASPRDAGWPLAQPDSRRGPGAMRPMVAGGIFDPMIRPTITPMMVVPPWQAQISPRQETRLQLERQGWIDVDHIPRKRVGEFSPARAEPVQTHLPPAAEQLSRFNSPRGGEEHPAEVAPPLSEGALRRRSAARSRSGSCDRDAPVDLFGRFESPRGNSPQRFESPRGGSGQGASNSPRGMGSPREGNSRQNSPRGLSSSLSVPDLSEFRRRSGIILTPRGVGNRSLRTLSPRGPTPTLATEQWVDEALSTVAARVGFKQDAEVFEDEPGSPKSPSAPASPVSTHRTPRNSGSSRASGSSLNVKPPSATNLTSIARWPATSAGSGTQASAAFMLPTFSATARTASTAALVSTQASSHSGAGQNTTPKSPRVTPRTCRFKIRRNAARRAASAEPSEKPEHCKPEPRPGSSVSVSPERRLRKPLPVPALPLSKASSATAIGTTAPPTPSSVASSPHALLPAPEQLHAHGEVETSPRVHYLTLKLNRAARLSDASTSAGDSIGGSTEAGPGSNMGSPTREGSWTARTHEEGSCIFTHRSLPGADRTPSTTAASNDRSPVVKPPASWRSSSVERELRGVMQGFQFGLGDHFDLHSDIGRSPLDTATRSSSQKKSTVPTEPCARPVSQPRPTTPTSSSSTALPRAGAAAAVLAVTNSNGNNGFGGGASAANRTREATAAVAAATAAVASAAAAAAAAAARVGMPHLRLDPMTVNPAAQPQSPRGASPQGTSPRGASRVQVGRYGSPGRTGSPRLGATRDDTVSRVRQPPKFRVASAVQRRSGAGAAEPDLKARSGSPKIAKATHDMPGMLRVATAAA